MARSVRIANFSGVLGDRFTALAEAVRGEPVDVVIGDYMAEITMSMVAAGWSGQATPGDAARGVREFYAEYFLTQVRPLLAEIAEKKIKVVVNAGIFNAAGMAGVLRSEIDERGLDLTVAHVQGDDVTDRLAELAGGGQLSHLDTGAAFEPDGTEVVATAYLGGWGIAAALAEGADVVVTGRVADASLVLGPAAWWHGWDRADCDRIAGAVVAAHIIECGPQATGGNFSGFASVPDNTLLAFPIAEVDADGSSVITKRPGDGGTVTVDTVTAQLMYEIQGPRYLNPDVVLHVDSLRLHQEGPDRVRISDVRGSLPPQTTKVGIHRPSGYRGATWVFPTGLDIDAKTDLLRRQADTAAEGLGLTELRVTPCGRPAQDPADQYAATVAVQVAAGATEPGRVRAFLARFASYGLGSIPGFYVDLSGPVVNESVRVDYWPGLVRQDDLRHEAVLADGRRIAVPAPKGEAFAGQPVAPASPPVDDGPTRRVPLGEVAYARTGDKGGNANLGVWTPAPHAGAYPWLAGHLTAERLRALLGVPDDVGIERYELPNIHGIAFVLRGYLGTSGSSYLGLDQIGKSLGEFLRAKHVDVPVALLNA